jgi:hypothetical protein
VLLSLNNPNGKLKLSVSRKKPGYRAMCKNENMDNLLVGGSLVVSESVTNYVLVVTHEVENEIQLQICYKFVS